MTGQLHLNLDSSFTAGEVVACEVIGGPDLTVRTAPLHAGQVSIVDVPQGFYLVRATLPSGHSLTATAEVSADEALQVQLAPPEPTVPPGPVTPGRDVELWAQRWELPANHPRPLMQSSVGEEPGRLTINLSTDIGRHCVQLGGVGTAWRIVHLPPAYKAVITVTRARVDDGFHNGVEVQVTGANPLATAMLGYLASGQLDSANIVAPELLEQARNLFQEKMGSPEGAAVAGYFLLRVGQQEILGDWPANFANWFDRLPDACVIHAWQLLRRPGVPDRDLARSRLIQAVNTGIPSYTEGLRLLFQGLQAFVSEEPNNDELRACLDKVSRCAAACDWTATHTTYWATAPDKPTLSRHTGFPESEWTPLTLRDTPPEQVLVAPHRAR